MPVCLFREFEKPYTSIDIGPVRRTPDLDQALHLSQLAPDLRSLPVVRPGVDPPVETVVKVDPETIFQRGLLGNMDRGVRVHREA